MEHIYFSVPGNKKVYCAEVVEKKQEGVWVSLVTITPDREGLPAGVKMFVPWKEELPTAAEAYFNP